MIEEKKIPWYKKIHRFGQTNLTEDDPAKCDIEFWRSYWRDTKIQGVIINCGGIVAYYQSNFPLQYKAQGLGGKDFFAEFNQAAREEGLYVIARMDINCTKEDFYQTHPDWFAKDKEGNPIKTQGRFVSCVNSGYYKEYIPAVLSEIIDKYHPDGFADNSWKGLPRNTICYCDNCKKKFREEYGLDLPKKVSFRNPVYRKWIKFSYRSRLENWDLFNETTKRVGGEDCLWFGMINGDPFHSVGSFMDIRAFSKRSPIIFSDHQFRDEKNGFEQNSANGALLRLVSQENRILLESMSHYYKGGHTYRLISAPAGEVRAWMLSGVAGGVSPWYHHVGGGTNDRRQFSLTKDIFAWHNKNDEYLFNRKNMANIGIVWSQENIDFYGREDYMERTAYPYIGFIKTLSKNAIPFLPIHADDLIEYKERLNTIILPELGILTKEQQEAIICYLKEGKNLIFSGKTSFFDEEGEPIENSLLYKELDLVPTMEEVGTVGQQDNNWMNHEAHNYIRLPKTRHEILQSFEDTDLLPFGGCVQVVESLGYLKPICGYIPAFPIYPPEFSWIREEREDITPIYAGILPSGSRVVYLAGDIDRCYGKDGIPDLGNLLAETIKWTTGDLIPIFISGVTNILVNLYKQEDRYILHLVNLNGGNTPLGTCENIIPAGEFTVRFSTDFEGEVTGFLTVEEQDIIIKSEGRIKTLTLNHLKEHEMIIIEELL